jgi:integrase
MAVYRHREQTTDGKDKETWRYRKQIRIGGTLARISGTPLVNTKVAAEAAERKAIEAALASPTRPPNKPEEVPTFATFTITFMATYATTNNKPSEQTAKESILKHHLLPAFGPKALDRISTADVEDLKAKLLRSKKNPDGVSRKRVNNVLHVLSKILKYALDIEVVDRVPRIKTLKVDPQKFDFFPYEEFEQLVAGSMEEPQWHAAVLVAGEAGLRLGEILALRWEDVDLVRGQLQVLRTDWRGRIGSPKGGRGRVVPLTARLLGAVKSIRHLRGPLVFCREDGARWTNTNMRAGIKRQEKRAGLRITGWHVLRHTFCSHLAMKGAPAKAIQDLAGHQSIAVTNRYMHLAPGALRSAIDLLEPGETCQAGAKERRKIA